MGYQEALEAAGAEIHIIQYFGSYRGDILARVTYGGKTGWIEFPFGSCSGCDAYESEFGWADPTPERLAAFGEGYLDNILSADEILKRVRKNEEWDMECGKMIKFIENTEKGDSNG